MIASLGVQGKHVNSLWVLKFVSRCTTQTKKNRRMVGDKGGHERSERPSVSEGKNASPLALNGKSD